jgi:hypothetical protein
MYIENWKPTITTCRKSMIYKPDVEIISTKTCPVCGNKELLLTRTLNIKTCTDCFLDIPWYLEEGQQPIL